jgi:HAD superfamily hydrolase (TIGR01509 family)
MQDVSAVILDLDGLMIETERVARDAWRRAASDLGHTMGDDLFAHMTGRRPEDYQEIVLAALGKDFPYQDVKQRRDTYLREAIDQEAIEARPGLFDLLKTLDRFALDVAIATSGHRDFTLRKLSAIGLDDSFETIVCGNEVEHGKPAPDIFLEAARRLDVPPSRCVVLEDSDAGARAAHAAGMRVIVVPEFKEPAEDVLNTAWQVLPSLHAAATFLREELKE